MLQATRGVKEGALREQALVHFSTIPVLHSSSGKASDTRPTGKGFKKHVEIPSDTGRAQSLLAWCWAAVPGLFGRKGGDEHHVEDEENALVLWFKLRPVPGICVKIWGEECVYHCLMFLTETS